MKRNLITAIMLLLGSSYITVHAMQKVARPVTQKVEQYTAKRLAPAYQKVREKATGWWQQWFGKTPKQEVIQKFAPTTKQVLKQTPKKTPRRSYSTKLTKLPPSRKKFKKAAVVGGLLASLFAVIERWRWWRWWSGRKKEIAEAVLGPDKILALDDFGGGLNKPPRASDKKLENPQYKLLSMLGIESFSSAVEAIAQKIEESAGRILSLETKKNLAKILSSESQMVDTENHLQAYGVVYSINLLPILLYMRNKEKKEGRYVTEVPETLLPQSTLYPVLYSGRDESPIIDVFKRTELDFFLNYDLFLNYVEQSTFSKENMEAMNIKVKDRKAFLEDVMSLLINLEYWEIGQEKDLLVVDDHYDVGQQNNKTATRSFSGITKQARYLSFGDDSLNKEWQNVYFGNQKALKMFFKPDGYVQPLVIIPPEKYEVRMIRVDANVNIKKNSIYHSKLLDDILDLVEKHQ